MKRERENQDWQFGPARQRFRVVGLVSVIAFLLLMMFGASPFWKAIESFSPHKDYRLPYELSKDYWLYDRYTRQSKTTDELDAPKPIYVVGDSVVWGEYVSEDGTLSHFLNAQDENTETRSFLNAGVNGLFPLALEGLVRHYGKGIRNVDVILHCNLLWMSSPEADLSSTKEQTFNHVELVPQFAVEVPCYKQSTEVRLDIVMRRTLEPLRLVSHLQHNYFDGKSATDWTLDRGEEYPPTYPNAGKIPMSQFDFKTKQSQKNDPLRGVQSDRHRSWRQRGMNRQSFDWVPLKSSLQWQAYRRLVQTLIRRGNRVFVLVGPFNEHMLSTRSKPIYEAMREQAVTWLQEQNNVSCVAPAPLASEQYGDASHPLTEGYEQLAEMLFQSHEFRDWLEESDEPK